MVDMKELGIWEPLAVKLQTYKTAVEVRHSRTCAVLFILDNQKPVYMVPS